MRGAGTRDPVTGAAGSLGPRAEAHLPSPDLGTRLARPSFPAVSNSLCSLGNQFLGLKLEGSGSEQFWIPEQTAGKKLSNRPCGLWCSSRGSLSTLAH